MSKAVIEGDLVMLRLPNDLNFNGRQRHYNTWLRIHFIDIDDSFVGEVERIDRHEFTLHRIGDHVRYGMSQIQKKHSAGDKWCYSDRITICTCPGLCRNK